MKCATITWYSYTFSSLTVFNCLFFIKSMKEKKKQLYFKYNTKRGVKSRQLTYKVNVNLSTEKAEKKYTTPT